MLFTCLKSTRELGDNTSNSIWRRECKQKLGVVKTKIYKFGGKTLENVPKMSIGGSQRFKKQI